MSAPEQIDTRSKKVRGPAQKSLDLIEAMAEIARDAQPIIAWAFGSDAGARLMRKDSDIAEAVMLEMLEATGIVPLSVHDSFIVPATLGGRLNEAMERQIGIEKSTNFSPNFATPHPIDNLQENPKVVSHYGGGATAPPALLPCSSPRPSASGGDCGR